MPQPQTKMVNDTQRYCKYQWCLKEVSVLVYTTTIEVSDTAVYSTD